MDLSHEERATNAIGATYKPGPAPTEVADLIAGILNTTEGLSQSLELSRACVGNRTIWTAEVKWQRENPRPAPVNFVQLPKRRIVRMSTDGSGTASGPGGWAVVMRFGDAKKEIFGGVEDATNNTMELFAAISGLRALKCACDVEVTTDSEYLLKGITEWVPAWRERGWRTASGAEVRNIEFWKELVMLTERHTVVWVWVAGHSGHEDNERCDELAGIERRKMIARLGGSDPEDSAVVGKPKRKRKAREALSQ